MTEVVAGLADTVADAAARLDCTPPPPASNNVSDASEEWSGPELELEEIAPTPPDAMDLDEPAPAPPPVAQPAPEREHMVWYSPTVIDPILRNVDENMADDERTMLYAVFLRASANWTRHQQRTTRRPRTVTLRDEDALNPEAWATLTDDERIAAADRVLANAFGTVPRVAV